MSLEWSEELTDAVEEHYETLEAIAASDIDLQLVDDSREILNEYHGVKKDTKINKFDLRYVYVIESSAGYVKIGRSNRPKERLRALSTGSPHELELLASVEFPNSGEVERKLQEQYEEYNLNGEWYDMPEKEKQALLSRIHDLQGIFKS